MVPRAITSKNRRSENLVLSTGRYTLNFSFIEHETLEKPLIAIRLNNVFDLGQIVLQPSEVQVVGQEAITNFHLDK
jgi:hypothetical protein